MPLNHVNTPKINKIHTHTHTHTHTNHPHTRITTKLKNNKDHQIIQETKQITQKNTQSD